LDKRHDTLNQKLNAFDHLLCGLFLKIRLLMDGSGLNRQIATQNTDQDLQDNQAQDCQNQNDQPLGYDFQQNHGQQDHGDPQGQGANTQDRQSEWFHSLTLLEQRTSGRKSSAAVKKEHREDA
jgi:hypothetical protein